MTDLSELHEAACTVFHHRGQHEWPPVIQVPDSWVEPYRRLAAEVGFPVSDVAEAAREVQAFIGEIAATPLPGPRH